LLFEFEDEFELELLLELEELFELELEFEFEELLELEFDEEFELEFEELLPATVMAPSLEAVCAAGALAGSSQTGEVCRASAPPPRAATPATNAVPRVRRVFMVVTP
jgi:hypothetical protein